MKKEDYKWIAAYVVLLLAVMGLFLSGAFAWANNKYPYIAGFFQFMIFASTGEILSARILDGVWKVNKATLFKAFGWGVGGIVVTLAFRVFSEGTERAMMAGMLPFYGNSLALAFFTSATNNFLFSPVHMASMRICDSYAELKYTLGKKSVAVRDAVLAVDWGELVDFSVFKTIPFFWLPINTLVFLLPPDYRILVAAALSFVFGMLMTVMKLRERKRKREGGNDR